MLPPFLGPLNALGYPAPYWFIQFFKVFGFTLHMALMNLWLAGLAGASREALETLGLRRPRGPGEGPD